MRTLALLIFSSLALAQQNYRIKIENPPGYVMGRPSDGEIDTYKSDFAAGDGNSLRMGYRFSSSLSYVDIKLSSDKQTLLDRKYLKKHSCEIQRNIINELKDDRIHLFAECKKIDDHYVLRVVATPISKEIMLKSSEFKSSTKVLSDDACLGKQNCRGEVQYFTLSKPIRIKKEELDEYTLNELTKLKELDEQELLEHKGSMYSTFYFQDGKIKLFESLNSSLHLDPTKDYCRVIGIVRFDSNDEVILFGTESIGPSVAENFVGPFSYSTEGKAVPARDFTKILFFSERRARASSVEDGNISSIGCVIHENRDITIADFKKQIGDADLKIFYKSTQPDVYDYLDHVMGLTKFQDGKNYELWINDDMRVIDLNEFTEQKIEEIKKEAE